MLGLVGKKRSDRRLEYVIVELEHLGVIEPTGVPDRFRYVRRLDADEVDEDAIKDKRRRDLERLLDVVSLVRTEDPRAYVLDYFGLAEDE